MYWVTGILGLILILAPSILGYSDHAAALWSNGVLGLAVVLVSACKALARDEGAWEYAAAIMLGLLAVVAPVALGFGTHGGAVWTSIVLGVVVAILAGYRLLAQPQPQSGRSGAWPSRATRGKTCGRRPVTRAGRVWQRRRARLLLGELFRKMIAFVLGGAGSWGALQVGALQVLLEAGIRPQLLVGSSAGALNAAFLATDPTPVGADRLGDLWRQVTKEDIYPGGLFRAVWHLLRCRDSLYSSKPFRAFLEVHIPREMRLFRQLPVALYVTAADLSTGRLYLFGEDPQESMLDALMASTAAPPLHAPVAYRGRLLVDGAVAANLPVGVALEKGATEVYALDVWGQPPRNARRWSLPEVATWSIRALMHQQWERELARCALHPEVRLYHLPLSSEGLPAFDDFSQATALIAAGRVQAEAYLAAQGLPRPEREGVHAPRWRHAFPLEEVRQEIERLSAAVAAHTHRPEAPNAALTSGAPPGGSPDGHAIRETRDSGRP